MKISSASLCALALLSLAACKPKTAPDASVATPASTPAPPATPAAAAAEAPSEAGRPRGPGGSGGPGGRGDFAERAKERFEQMKADLGLTEEQAQKITAIMGEQMSAMQALRSDDSLDREQRMAKFREARESIQAQIGAVLTPEQKAKWEEMRKQREGERGERRAKRPQDGGGPPPQQ